MYDGGLVVAGPRCATLEIYVDESPVANEIALGFGTGCPAGRLVELGAVAADLLSHGAQIHRTVLMARVERLG